MRTVAPSQAEFMSEPGMAMPSGVSSQQMPSPRRRPDASGVGLLSAHRGHVDRVQELVEDALVVARIEDGAARPLG